MSARAAHRTASRVLLLLLMLGLSPVVRAAEGAAAVPATPAEASAATTPAPADPADLGRGLRYFRPADADFTAALAAAALVLDLRETTDLAQAETRLQALLAHCDVAHPLLVLLDAGTPESLRAALPAHAPGLLTLAPADAGLPADILVASDATQEQAAVAALAAGETPLALAEEKVSKQRYDEAALVHDHANGVSERPPRNDTAPDGRSAEPADTPQVPPHDRLLQRALFIHRGLLALGRIPDHT